MSEEMTPIVEPSADEQLGLAPIPKSIEGRGGWKFEFRELEQKLEEKSRAVDELSTRVEELQGLVVRGGAAPDLERALRAELREFRRVPSRARATGVGGRSIDSGRRGLR